MRLPALLDNVQISHVHKFRVGVHCDVPSQVSWTRLTSDADLTVTAFLLSYWQYVF